VSCSSTGCTRPATCPPSTTTCTGGGWTARTSGSATGRWTPAVPDSSTRCCGASSSTARSPAGDLSERVGKKGTWWDWDDGKVALEHLFWSGQVTAVRRANDFARLYDLTERVLPAHVLATPAPAEAEARKELLVLAAKHHGVGTMTDLTDYHRQKNAPCKPLLDELVEEGRCTWCRWRAGPSRRTCTRRRSCRAASTPAPCSARSIPCAGTATATSACSGSTTASRSTRRRRSAPTATTCCRSCGATRWSGGST
jgi:hypothetical protein